MYDILVIGSINADLVFTTKVRPKKGETVLGEDFKMVPGGKGANQAVAASKLGAKVALIGCLGKDQNGIFLENNLKENNVETKYIKKVEDVPSGVAGITLSEQDNSIIVIPGANYKINKDLIDKNKDIILKSKIVLLQLEIPIEVVKYIIEICSENNIKTVLNPAPIRKLDKKTLDRVSYLTPNEHEFKILFKDKDEREVLKDYKNKLLITKGDKGVSFFDGEKFINMPSKKVEVVDSTGAGDTFNGALALALVRGKNLKDSVEFANKAAALSVTKFGAQGGMPTLEEVEEFNQ